MFVNLNRNVLSDTTQNCTASQRKETQRGAEQNCRQTSLSTHWPQQRSPQITKHKSFETRSSAKIYTVGATSLWGNNWGTPRPHETVQHTPACLPRTEQFPLLLLDKQHCHCGIPSRTADGFSDHCPTCHPRDAVGLTPVP